jgi:hypothetical protein
MRETIREKLVAIITDLERCAKQNEADAKTGAGWGPHPLDGEARAVAGEQRRMIKILKAAIV